MPAYVIVDCEVTDPERYEVYKELAPPAIAKYGGRYLVRGGDVTPLEGDWRPDRIVILEFPDVDTAKRFYASPEYGMARGMSGADLEQAAGRAVEAALSAGAGDAEAWAERSVEREIRVYEGAVESLTDAAASGIGIRSFSDGRWGYAYGTDLSDEGLAAAYAAHCGAQELPRGGRHCGAGWGRERLPIASSCPIRVGSGRDRRDRVVEYVRHVLPPTSLGVALVERRFELGVGHGGFACQRRVVTGTLL